MDWQTLIALVGLVVACLLGLLSLVQRNRAAPPPPGPGLGTNIKNWFEKWGWWVGGAVVIGGLVWLYNLKAPALADVGDGSWNHWLFVLALGVVVWLALAIKKDLLGAATGSVQSMIPLVVLVLLVGIPVWNWGSDFFISSPSCPNGTLHESRQCPMNGKWSELVGPGDGMADDGAHLCLSDGIEYQKVVQNGTSYLRLRGPKGTIARYQFMVACHP